ncbi:hypothetical protein BRAO375_1590045 [Bradyrhizobium sp. ORS 375]|nr:hypothetical protein BRAO375_1590045 [Bradyrhizobium sp. ORS 375]
MAIAAAHWFAPIDQGSLRRVSKVA